MCGLLKTRLSRFYIFFFISKKDEQDESKYAILYG